MDPASRSRSRPHPGGATGATDRRVPRPSAIGTPPTAARTAEDTDQMADQIRVLIVDDIPETRDHLTKLLGFESDIEVVGSRVSGMQAFELASELKPEVVLMDINMPDMDGIAATERLSAESRRRGRDDVRPGRGGLPPPIDARRRPRVPRQAVQQRRAHRLDPAGLRARAGEGRRMAIAPVATAGGGGPVEGRGEAATATAIVAIFCPKGGVGRTTIAVNMAIAAEPSWARRSSSSTARSSSATSACSST